MMDQIGLDADSGWARPVRLTEANADHDTQEPGAMHGREEVAFADAC